MHNIVNEAKFDIGEIIDHKLFGYRGVIADVDPCFMGTEAWYQNMAKSQPPKHAPWYHVLVDNSNDRTYVSEQNLASSTSLVPIQHPLIATFFKDFFEGHYLHKQNTI